jgi:hypothetical protein
MRRAFHRDVLAGAQLRLLETLVSSEYRATCQSSSAAAARLRPSCAREQLRSAGTVPNGSGACGRRRYGYARQVPGNSDLRWRRHVPLRPRGRIDGMGMRQPKPDVGARGRMVRDAPQVGEHRRSIVNGLKRVCWRCCGAWMPGNAALVQVYDRSYVQHNPDMPGGTSASSLS